MSQRVLFMEPRSEGHHTAYLAWMIESLLRKGMEITVATTDSSVQSVSMRELVSKFGSQICFISLPELEQGLDEDTSIKGLWKRHCAYYTLFKDVYLASKGQFDHIHLPYVDYCDKALAVFGSPFGATSWSGLSMRLSFHLQACGVKAPRKRTAFLEQMLFKRLLKQGTLGKFFVIDEPLFEYAKARLGNGDSRLVYLADPQDFVRTADPWSKLEIPSNRKYLLLFGSLDERKGIGLLSKLIAEDAFPSDWNFILAGRISETDESRFFEPLSEEQRAKIHLFNRFVSSAEAAACFSIAHVVWLHYAGHYGSSGVQALAAAAGVPTIATSDGLIGWNSARHKLGLILDPELPPRGSEWEDAMVRDFDPILAEEYGDRATVERAMELFGTGIAACVRSGAE